MEFARTGVPESQGLTSQELADHSKVLLGAIAKELRGPESDSQSREKSVGKAPSHAPEITRIACDHAQQRFAQGFSLEHVMAEFRALRASVLRRWEAPRTSEGIDELIRFGESIDQALAASASLYTSKVNDARNLLLGVLGHDLRTPLSVVTMGAQYPEQAQTLNAKQAQFVARIGR